MGRSPGPPDGPAHGRLGGRFSKPVNGEGETRGCGTRPAPTRAAPSGQTGSVGRGQRRRFCPGGAAGSRLTPRFDTGERGTRRLTTAPRDVNTRGPLAASRWPARELPVAGSPEASVRTDAPAAESPSRRAGSAHGARGAGSGRSRQPGPSCLPRLREASGEPRGRGRARRCGLSTLLRPGLGPWDHSLAETRKGGRKPGRWGPERQPVTYLHSADLGKRHISLATPSSPFSRRKRTC